MTKEEFYDLKIGNVYEIRFIPPGSLVREGIDSKYDEMVVKEQNEEDQKTKVRYLSLFHYQSDGHIYEQKYIDQDNWTELLDCQVIGKVAHSEDSKIECEIPNFRRVKLIGLS